MKKTKIIKAVVAVVLCAAVVVSAIFGVSFLKLKSGFDPSNLPEDFTMTAHTGCMGEKDNSLEAMQAAADAGAQIVEFDLNFDSNGVPVLSHDEPTGDEVTLEQAFDFLSKNPQLLANVDAKSTANLSEVQRLAKEHDVLQQLFFTGIEEKDVVAVNKQCPDIPYYLNVDVDKSRINDSDYLEELSMKIIFSKAVGINMHKRAATKELCSFFHSRGILVSVYTVDGKYELYRVLTAGPDNITTRRPDRLSQILSD